MKSVIEKKCIEQGVKMTDNRRLVAKILSDSNDHPDVEEVYKRCSKLNPNIGIATVYRSLKVFEEFNVIAKHDFRNEGKARYEKVNEDEHHDHLIDISNDKVYEFYNEELEQLKNKIAKDMGFELVDHRLDLYCRPIKKI
jgi:Fur family ferric uptake transcriptional regulator